MLNYIIRLGMVLSCALTISGAIISVQNGNTAATVAYITATAAIIMAALSDVGR